MGIITNEMLCATSVLAGMGIVAEGVRKISEGDVANGAKQVVGGLAAVDLGSYAMDATAITTNRLMHASLLGGAVGAITNGTLSICQGTSELDPMQILSGLGQTAAGLTIGLGLHSIEDIKMIAIAERTILLVAVSCQISYRGAKDFANGRRLKGALEMGLGLGGMIFAGYCVLEEAAARSFFGEPSLPSSWEKFLSNNAADIEQLYTTKRAAGNFKQLGEGISKKVFTHPELPDAIVKISYRQSSFWNHGITDGEFHVQKLQSLRANLVRDGYRQVALPNSFLVRTQSGGPVVIEEKVDLSPSRFIFTTQSEKTAIAEFDDFTRRYQIGDLTPDRNHNSGFLRDKKDTIVIFDVDCPANAMFPIRSSRLLEETSENALRGALSTTLATTLAERRFGAVAKSIVGLSIIGIGVAHYQNVLERDPEALAETALTETFQALTSASVTGILDLGTKVFCRTTYAAARSVHNIWQSIVQTASICDGLI